MNTSQQLKKAFDETLQKWVVFYTTDRIDYDFETGQQLEPIMCDYHVVSVHDKEPEI
jgi:hypothetical protein